MERLVMDKKWLYLLGGIALGMFAVPKVIAAVKK